MPAEPHINALVSSLEFIAGIKPEIRFDSWVLPVVDAVLAEHGVTRGDTVRADELLILARKAQAA